MLAELPLTLFSLETQLFMVMVGYSVFVEFTFHIVRLPHLQGFPSELEEAEVCGDGRERKNVSQEPPCKSLNGLGSWVRGRASPTTDPLSAASLSSEASGDSACVGHGDGSRSWQPNSSRLPAVRNARGVSSAPPSFSYFIHASGRRNR